MPPLHPNAQAVADRLAALEVAGQVHMFSERVATAAQAAERLGVSIGAIANSLVFDGDGRPFLILASGAHRVDTDKCAALLGVQRLRRATPEFVRAATGQPIGGVAPVGHPQPLPTLVDVALRQYETVWAAAGHPNASFPTTFDELLRITHGTATEVAG
ncbi:MAG TPA: YbaK/EbsC family protein [Actinocrinis sp.]|jgi:prolyl-tRNA editing enzyme YbaK/EbsC (Cys-tRNA(Pro) deacylase)|uniref:YbaK/EbsC family protein n=1 Tax=Actinocrinis sp. TaxID=1920516 RepID=UPI002D2302B2|nr:YbaK/EbsC family protein [Actinocrinis sp.]HZU57652.1 YbaK/EbsC family protein [Actinocrinis sp.]